MNCIICNGKLITYKTIKNLHHGDYVIRYKKCEVCGYNYKTIERMDGEKWQNEKDQTQV